MSKKKFKYKKRDDSTIKKRAAQTGFAASDGYISDEVTLFTPHDGDNLLRVIPPTWENADHYGMDLFVHYGIGPDRASYLCLDAHKNEACPVCDARNAAEAEGDEELVKELRATKRVAFYLLDRDAEKDGILLWAAPWTIDRDLCQLCTDKRTGESYPLDDPEDGYDFEFTRTGKGIGTKYSGIQIGRNPCELDNEEAMDFAVANPIPEMLKFYDYDHIKEVVARTPTPAASEEEEEAPRSRKLSRKKRDDEPRSRKRKKAEQEEEEQEDDSAQDSKDLTYAEVFELSEDELVELIEERDLDIDDDLADDELAEAVCDELGIEKPARKSRMDRLRDKKKKK